MALLSDAQFLGGAPALSGDNAVGKPGKLLSDAEFAGGAAVPKVPLLEGGAAFTDTARLRQFAKQGARGGVGAAALPSEALKGAEAVGDMFLGAPASVVGWSKGIGAALTGAAAGQPKAQTFKDLMDEELPPLSVGGHQVPLEVLKTPLQSLHKMLGGGEPLDQSKVAEVIKAASAAGEKRFGVPKEIISKTISGFMDFAGLAGLHASTRLPPPKPAELPTPAAKPRLKGPPAEVGRTLSDEEFAAAKPPAVFRSDQRPPPDEPPAPPASRAERVRDYLRRNFGDKPYEEYTKPQIVAATSAAAAAGVAVGSQLDQETALGGATAMFIPVMKGDARLNAYEKMKASGATRTKRWQSTGIVELPGVGPVEELSDAAGRLKIEPRMINGKAVASLSAGHEMPLSEVIDHPELFGRFPELKNLLVRPTNQPGMAGEYHPRTSTIYINHGSPEEVTSTLLHEINHYFVPGTSPKQFLKRGITEPTATRLYERQYGEALARATEARRGMSEEERRATPPWQSFDVPEEQWLLGFGGASAAVKPKGGMWHPEAVERLARPLMDSIIPPELRQPQGTMSDAQLTQRMGLTEWSRKSIRNYLNKHAGTATDPLRDVRIPMLGEDVRWEDVTDRIFQSAPARYFGEFGQKSGLPKGVPAEESIWTAETEIANRLRSETVQQTDARTRGVLALQSYLSHVGDYLREHVPPERLQQYDLVRAVRETAQQDARQAAKMAKARATGEGTVPYKTYPDGMRWVEVQSDEALKNEGDVMGHCFPAGTLVTAPEPNLIERMKVGDSVITHTGAVRKVTQCFERAFKGKLVTVSTRGALSFSCTEEHPILIVRPVSTGSVWKDRYVANRLPETLLPQWTLARDLLVGDYLLSPGIQQQAADDNKDFSWMCGLYAGDGHCEDYRIGFTLSPQDDLERVGKVFEALGYRPRFEDHDTYWRIKINSKELAQRFKGWFGRSVKEKKLPEFLFRDADLQEVLNGLVAADGTFYEGRWRLVSTSIALAQQAWLIAVSLGYRPSIKPLNRKPGQGFANASSSWSVEWQEQEGKWHSNIRWNAFYATPVVEVSARQFEGTVYNLEVEEDHSYLVNGLAVHNCVGGYCEMVHQGQSKIYSLRDAKGMSHVTVEVAPEGQGINRWTPEGETESTLPSIVQIKGKQNRAPVAAYLPYVQDFIRNPVGGKPWGEVGDLENAGLADIQQSKINSEPYRKLAEELYPNQRFLTKAEHERLQQEGIKRTLAQPRQRGAADPRQLAAIAAAGVGAAAGAALNPDHPWLGGALGVVAGAGALKAAPLVGKGLMDATKAALQSGSLYERTTRAAGELVPGPISQAFAQDSRIRIKSQMDAAEVFTRREELKANRAVNEVLTLVPREADRTAISHAIEAGNTAALSGPAQRAAAIVQGFFKGLGEKGLAAGTIKDLVDQYVTHVFGREALPLIDEMLKERSMGTASSVFGKTRQGPPTIAEVNAWMASKGRPPITSDIAKIMTAYSNSMIKAIANRTLIDTLKQTAVPALRNGKTVQRAVVTTKPIGNYVPLGKYNLYVHPDILPALRFVFDQDNSPGIMRGVEAVNTALKRTAVSFSLFHAKSLVDAMAGGARLGKRNMLIGAVAGGAYGAAQGDPITYAMIGAGLGMAAKGLKLAAQSAAPKVFGENRYVKALRTGDPAMAKLIDLSFEGGLQYSLKGGGLAVEEASKGFYEGLEAARRTLDTLVPGAGGVVKGVEAVNHAMDTFMWDRLHTAMKLEVFAEKYETLTLNDTKGLSDTQRAEAAASYTNDIFGGLNWRRIAEEGFTRWGRDLKAGVYRPSGRRILRLAMFAPDWTISTTRAALKSFGGLVGQPQGGGIGGLLNPRTVADLHRQYMIRSAFYYAMIGDGLNVAFTGHHLWQNKDPTYIELADGRKMQFSKHTMEPYHWIQHPVQQALNKLGQVPKEALNQMFGTEYLNPRVSQTGKQVYAGPEMKEGRAKHLLQQLSPIGVQQFAEGPVGGVTGAVGMPIYGRTREQIEAERKARKGTAARLEAAHKRREKALAR